MKELPERQPSEEINKTKWDRTKAVMGTLLYNNNIKIDSVGILGAAGVELIKRVGNVEITSGQQVLISANLFLWARPIVTGLKDVSAKKQLEIIMGFSEPKDTRSAPKIIIDSWRTGEVQKSQKQGGKN